MLRKLGLLLFGTVCGVLGQKPELVLQTGPVDTAAVLAFSPDQTTLAAMVTSGSTVRIYSVATGAELATLETGAQTFATVPGALRYSRDGRVLWTLVEGSFREFDVRTGALGRSKSFDLGGRRVENWQISADGQLAVGKDSHHKPASRSDETVGAVVLDLELGLEMKPGYEILAVGPDGKLVLTHGTIASLFSPGKETVYQWPVRELATGRVVGGLEPRASMLKARRPPDFAELFRQASIQDFQFGVDGKQVAGIGLDAARSATSLILYDLPAGKGRTVALGMAGRSQHSLSKLIALTPDLKLAAAADEGSVVSITDLAGGQTVAKFTAGTADVVALAFSADRRMLATGGVDRNIAIWDVGGAAAGNVTRLRGMGENALPVHALEFTADGRSLVVGTTQSVNAWDLASGTATRWLSVPFEAPPSEFWANEAKARSTSLSTGGKLVLLGSRLKATIWDSRSGRELLNYQPQPGCYFTQPALSPNGELLLVTEQSGYVSEQEIKSAQRVFAQSTSAWSMTRRERERFGKFIGEIQKAVERKDKKKADEIERKARQELSKPSADILSAVRAGYEQAARPPQAAPTAQAKLIRVATGEVVWKSAAGPMTVAGISPDGRWLARTDDPSTPSQGAVAEKSSCRLRLVDRESGVETQSKQIADCAVGWSTFSPDGRLLSAAYMSASRDKGSHVKAWEVSAQGLGRELLTVSTGAYPGSVRFSPDGKLLAVTEMRMPTRLVDTATGETRFQLENRDLVTSVSFSPDGTLVATGSTDAETHLWEAATGKRLASLVLMNGGSDWLVVTPDGLFDGTPAAWRQILWRFSENLKDVAPVESYFTEFYYPGLLGDLTAGKRPNAPVGVEEKDRRQPAVVLAAEGGGRSMTVKVTVTEPDAGVGARDVRLFRNGTLVKVWRGDVLARQNQAALQVAVSVIAGENTFTAYAFNRDNVKSADATLVVRGDAGLARKGVAYVLSVGVNRYANADYNLKYAVADADAFGEEVGAQQKKLGVYEKVEVVSLKDGEATKARVLESLKMLAAKAQPEDLVALYFAGHGVARGARFYLVPHDLGYAGPRTRLDAEAFEAIAAHSISDTELESAMEGLDSGQLLLVIDACNSGQALEADEKRRGPMNSSGLAQLAYEKGMYILTAAQSYQAALEAAELGHGYLTYTLVEEGLKRSAADYDAKDGQILAREWFNYAMARVPQLQQRAMDSRILVFAEGDQSGGKTTQQPRLFYRREGEARPLVVGRP